MNKLYRSRSNRIIAGVCGGIANYFGIDVSIVRIITLLLIFVGGVSIWIYIIAALVIPLEPGNENFYKRNRYINDDSFKKEDFYKEKSYEKNNDEEDFY